jgi:hypothetical protein
MNVQFEENNIPRNYGSFERTPAIAAWLIKKGVVKDVAGANRLQIFAAIVFFGLAIYFAIK